MGKVVTSQGLQEFVESGKVTHVTDHKPGEVKAEPLEVKKDPPLLESKETKEELKVEAETDEDGLTPEERKLLGERIDKIVGKKHRAMKEAQEAAAEAERFAETQFNERKMLESREQQLQNELNELKTKTAPKVEEELKAPNIEDFRDAQGQVDWDKLTDAKADYRAELAIRKERLRLADEKAAADRAEVERRVKVSADKARKAHTDFDEVMSSIKGTDADQVPQYVLNYLSDSENAGTVAYHLAKNPEEAARIAKLPPIRGIVELGKLEDKLITPAKPNGTQGEKPVIEPIRAPAPIVPLSGEGAGHINTDPSKMSYRELRAYERERERKRGS